MNNFILKSIAILSLLLFIINSSFSAKKDNIVANVNGKVITKSQLEKEYKESRYFVSNKVMSKERVLYNMINKIIGVDKARKEKTDRSPEVIEKIEDVIFHAQISKDLKGKLKNIKINNTDIKNYYKENPEYRTAHILFRVRANPSENEWKAAFKQAHKIYKEIKKSPKKFPEFANKYSQSNTASSGGDLNFMPAVRLAPEYFNAIKGKNEGFITAPVRTQFGYHIIKVLSKKKFNNIDNALYKKIVYNQKRDKILERYFNSLRKSAKVKINKNLLN